MSFRPFQEAQVSLGNLQDDMNRMFERVWHAGVSTGPFDGQQWAPSVDLYEGAESYFLFVEVPGVDANEIEVSYVGNCVTIRGEKTKPAELEEDVRPMRRERRFGTFSRTVDLPGDLDADRLSARCHGGVLSIVVPKSESSRPTGVRIEVQDG